MTAYELCALPGDVDFTIGESKVVWETATYKDSCDKVLITRLVNPGESGRQFLMGLNYRQRYIDPETIIHPVKL